MALQFRKQEVPCIRNVLSQVQNLEQTQELRLPEGMSGTERIVGCRGQVLIRSKEWRGDMVRFSGGVQAWVLYVPEDGAAVKALGTWIPFQSDWELPENCREGQIQGKALLRYADARTVSAGKVLIRVGIGLQLWCWSPEDMEVYHPEGEDGDVELLRQCWPVMLPKAAGEKTFVLEEELRLPPSTPVPEALLYYRMTADAAECRVLGNKLVFRGAARVHVLCLEGGGQVFGWDFELPVSQYVQLDDSFSGDAQGTVLTEVTALEIVPENKGVFRLRAELTGQYLVTDRVLLETAADAYAPCRELTMAQTRVELPVLLDTRQEQLRCEKCLAIQADVVTETVMLPDHLRQHQNGDVRELELTGTVQLLWYDQEGRLQGTSGRWEGNLEIKTDEKTRLAAIAMEPQTQVQEGAESVTVRTEVPVRLEAFSDTAITMVTAAEPGERKALPENRPSLILRRPEGLGLWELARCCGSRVSLIREANGLEGDAAGERMLLIPVV